MSDYSWIKPGVRAVIIDSVLLPDVIGAIVTIKSPPKLKTYPPHGEFIGVEIYNDRYLMSLMGRNCKYIPLQEHLKKFDDEFELVNWEEINNLLGVDIRNIKLICSD